MIAFLLLIHFYDSWNEKRIREMGGGFPGTGFPMQESEIGNRGGKGQDMTVPVERVGDAVPPVTRKEGTEFAGACLQGAPVKKSRVFDFEIELRPGDALALGGVGEIGVE
jgi:hypothetical protein